MPLQSKSLDQLTNVLSALLYWMQLQSHLPKNPRIRVPRFQMTRDPIPPYEAIPSMPQKVPRAKISS